MSHDHNGGLCAVNGTPAQVHQRGVGHRCREAEADNLGDIGRLERHVVQHGGMEGLGLKVPVAPFLAHMGSRNQMNHFLLHIFDGFAQVAERFRLQAHHRPDNRSLHVYLAAQVNLCICA
ncbi:MAG: hypothetical protein DDT38_01596 [Firmicutes bacterium]|nr:hypothetical protein [candidate division NPL-UPA2 bacterium]